MIIIIIIIILIIIFIGIKDVHKKQCHEFVLLP